MSTKYLLDKAIWSGRIDHSDSPENSLRWHQKIQSFNDYTGEPGLALIGFSCDEGVRRNFGRVGAAEGPDAIRHILANLPWYRTGSVYDFGNISCDQCDLESAQNDFSDKVATALNNHLLPIGLGGGQEIAWASYKGLINYLAHSQKSTRGANIGIINFDAHLDVQKPVEAANSGTPFWQVAQHCQHQNQPFHYLCLGVSKNSNTKALFQQADELEAVYICDDQFSNGNIEFLIEEVECFTGMVDHVFLSIDLSVFSSSDAPGVSSPAVRGVPLALIDTLLNVVKSSEKLRVIDIAELNPKYDHDNRTARLAAWLVQQITYQDF